LPQNVLVVAGGHDQALAALGSGAVKPGDSVDGMGSSECMTVILGADDISGKMAEYNFCCEPHVIEDAFITLAFNASAGTAIKWYRDSFNAERAREARARGENIYRIMDEECPDAPTGILFLPYVAGSGTPYFDSRTGGAFVGLRQGDDSAAVYKAVLEGISYEIRFNMELLKVCGIAPDTITAAGGGARSDVLMQIKADVMNQRIDVLETWETGTVALALLCARATGDIENPAAAAIRLAKRTKSFTPDAERAAYYEKQMKRYRKLYPFMLELL
jgi:xylulokinase